MRPKSAEHSQAALDWGTALLKDSDCPNRRSVHAGNLEGQGDELKAPGQERLKIGEAFTAQATFWLRGSVRCGANPRLKFSTPGALLAMHFTPSATSQRAASSVK